MLAYIPSPYNPSPRPLGPPIGTAPLDLAKSREEGEQLGNAVQRLVDDLGLKVTLKAEGVPREDVQTIATRAVGEEKKGTRSGKRWSTCWRAFMSSWVFPVKEYLYLLRKLKVDLLGPVHLMERNSCLFPS